MLALLRIELLKTRRSLALLMLLLCPLAVSLLNLAVFMRSNPLASFKATQWPVLWQQGMALWCYFMLPLTIALLTTLLNGSEHRNGSWRLMLSLPIRREQFFLAKLVLAWLLLLFAHLLLLLLFMAQYWLLPYCGYPAADANQLLPLSLLPKLLLASLPALLIHHLVSWHVGNVVFPLTVGVIATMGVMQIGSSEWWVYYPWSYMLMSGLGGSPALQHSALQLGLLLGLALILPATYLSARRSMPC